MAKTAFLSLACASLITASPLLQDASNANILAEVSPQPLLASDETIDVNQICQDKLCIFTNVATEWGVTYRNYKSLSHLAAKHADNLAVFYQPSNQFGKQEPFAGEELKQKLESYFASSDFELTDNQYWFKRADVIGKDKTDLFATLSENFPRNSIFGDDIQWNFEKFMVLRGKPIFGRIEAIVDPIDYEKEIDLILA